MNNISIANETIRITKERKYTLGSREILLPDLNFEKVIVISPDKGEKIIDHGCLKYKKESMCRIEILNSDSFQAGRNYDNPLVMNFANAHHPGGGFLLGANAQEESLCRCSTLYASLTSKRASEMYRYNNTHPSKVESDYMLLSPDVAVFRNENYNLLDSVSVMGVITVPAPNRRGAAFFASKELIKETFIRRIRILLLVASKYGYKNLVLGAWGCGAFGNDPKDVAEYFKYVLVDEEYGKCFDKVCFAIYGSENGKNITAFRNAFAYSESVTRTNKNDRIRGCLVGGAIGDAIGYAVEFQREPQIFSRYGKKGITEYELDKPTGKALISDDTQMTLFTATGIMAKSKNGILYDIEQSYFDWLTTQYYSFDEAKMIEIHNSWLRNVPELHSPRAPGNTCLSALAQRIRNTERTNSFIESKINNSKGCGGIMRVAPIGLIPVTNIDITEEIAAEAAAITHSHSLGYLPAAVLAHIINRIVYPVTDMSLKEIVSEAKETINTIFADDPYVTTLSKIMDLALELSENKESDLDNIHRLGEGWVGEETLGIALYCSLRYQNDFSKGIIAAVNHNGDSDSTGAVTGNILGALFGYDAIENKWKDNLELKDVILKVSDDLSKL